MQERYFSVTYIYYAGAIHGSINIAHNFYVFYGDVDFIMVKLLMLLLLLLVEPHSSVVFPIHFRVQVPTSFVDMNVGGNVFWLS